MSNLAEQIKYNYNEYLKWDDDVRYELIDGVPYAMASPSRLHQKTSMKLSSQFSNFLRGKTCEVYNAPFDVRLNFDSFDDIVVQPDILVVCDESKHDGKSVKGAPDMVIEIISPYNARHDTIIKFRLYQRAGVKEYWIVDPGTKTVQVYILQNGKYGVGKIYRDDDVITVNIFKDCDINLADVFYDISELELEDESAVKQKIINAMKVNNISDEQIEKVIDLI